MFRTHTKLVAGMLATAALTVPSLGCNELEDAIDLNLPPFDVPIPVPLPVIYPSAEELDGIPTGANGDRTIELPPIYANNIDLSAFAPSIGGGSVIDSVEIVGVTLTIEDNSLDVPIQPIDIRVGEAQATFDTALGVALSDELPPRFAGEHQAPIITTNQAAVGDILAGAAFGVGMRTQLVIPPDLPAGGRATARLKLRMRVSLGR